MMFLDLGEVYHKYTSMQKVKIIDIYLRNKETQQMKIHFLRSYMIFLQNRFKEFLTEC